MFSKACEYGIKATLFIALKSLQNNRASLKDIAREINSPEAFTAKILQQLVKHEIATSTKGPNGGFEIAKGNLGSLKLSKIVNAIDGDTIYKGCGLGLEECDARRPCPVHEKFKRIRDELKKMLENTSVLELATNLEIGLTCLKR